MLVVLLLLLHLNAVEVLSSADLLRLPLHSTNLFCLLTDLLLGNYCLVRWLESADLSWFLLMHSVLSMLVHNIPADCCVLRYVWIHVQDWGHTSAIINHSSVLLWSFLLWSYIFGGVCERSFSCGWGSGLKRWVIRRGEYSSRRWRYLFFNLLYLFVTSAAYLAEAEAPDCFVDLAAFVELDVVYAPPVVSLCGLHFCSAWC